MAEKLVLTTTGVPGIQVWNTADWSRDTVAYTSASGVYDAKFNRSNNRILTAYQFNPKSILYQATDWSRDTSLGFGGLGGVARGVAHSPNGSWSIVVSQDAFRTALYNSATWAFLQNLANTEGAEHRGPDFSPDSSQLCIATASPSVPVVRYDTATWTRQANPTGAGGRAYECAFSRSGTMLAVAASDAPRVSIIRTDTWTQLAVPSSQPTSIALGVSWNEDDSLLAVAHYNSPYLSVYETTNWTRISQPTTLPEGNATACAFNTAGTLLAVNHTGGNNMSVYDVSTWARIVNANLTATGGGWGAHFTHEAVTPPTGLTQNAIFHGHNF